MGVPARNSEAIPACGAVGGAEGSGLVGQAREVEVIAKREVEQEGVIHQLAVGIRGDRLGGVRRAWGLPTSCRRPGEARGIRG